MTASNSSIQAFKRCRRKWWLSYVMGWVPRERSVVGPLPFGSRIHAALEAMYARGEDPVAAHADLIEKDREAVLEAMGDADKLNDDAELGQIMLEGYVDWVSDEGLDDGLEIIGVEESLLVPLLDGRVNLIGKMDLRVRQSDARSVLDWKTAAQLSDYDLAPMYEQGPTYWVLDRMSDADERIDSFTLRLLKKVKRTTRASPPFYEQIHVRFNPFTMRSFWTRLHGELADMYKAFTALQNGADHKVVAYPSPNRNCRWDCPFVSICPMFDDGSAVQEAIDADFEQGDPFAYYKKESE